MESPTRHAHLDVLTPTEAGRMLRCSAATVRRLAANGRLPARDIGMAGTHEWRIPRAALLAWLSKTAAPADSAAARDDTKSPVAQS